MMDLNSSLKEYEKITKQLIECLEKDNFDDLDNLFDKRDTVISEISSTSYDQSEFKAIAEQLGLLSLENDLNNKVDEKRKDVISKMDGINKSKIANKNYYKKNYEDSLLFNKKI